MIEQAFEVATEFRFDIGQAMINTNALTQAVGQLSDASDSALKSLNYLAGGLVAHLGFGSGGLLSVLKAAVTGSESAHENVLKFANVLGNNLRTLTGGVGTFNERLATSQTILDDISDTSIKFGIPTDQLASLTSMLATPLSNAGRSGTNMSGAIEMSRNLMLAAPMANLHPAVASESLYRAITAGMPLHGALFARLANTDAFKSAHVTNQQQIMHMMDGKKIDLLSKALAQLGGSADALNYRMNSISVQFTRLKNIVEQFLRPIGDAIREPVIKMMIQLNAWMQAHAKNIGESLGTLLDGFLHDPKGLATNLLQLRRLRGDFHLAIDFTQLYGLFRFIKWIAGGLGITFDGGILMFFFRTLKEGVMIIADIVPWATLLSGAFVLFEAALLDFAVPFLAFLGIFQTISRAIAIAHIHDLAAWGKLGPAFLDLMTKFKNAITAIFFPITQLMDFFARHLAWIFETSFAFQLLLPIMDGFVDKLQSVGEIMLEIGGFVEGVNNVMYGLVNTMAGYNWQQLKKNFQSGYDDFQKSYADSLGRDHTKNTSQTYNTNNINARFDMREQLEPDRIAFAVTEHLKKLTVDAQTSRGKSLARVGTANIAGARK